MFRASGWRVIALFALVGCGGKALDNNANAAASTATPGASVAPATGSAAAPTAETPPPPKPVVDPKAVAAKVTSCPKEKERDKAAPARLFVSPQDPTAGDTVKTIVVPSGDAKILEAPGDGVVVVDPAGAATNADVETRAGPPASLYADVKGAAAGAYRFVVHRGGEVVTCLEVPVASQRPKRPGGAQGIPWESTRAWDRDYENLYSAWIEKLFDSPVEDSFSVTHLHEITKDPAKNFLHDYLGLAEDAPPPKGLRLDPDCADLPYFTRAYFAFKMSLPFTYSACSRGGGGQAPRCQESQSNLDPMDEPVTNRIRRFETFLRSDLKNVVHSGTGRTLATEDQTDYYAIDLSPETLRPGTVYADPYGHILMVSKRVPQTGDGAGLLFAVDGQPDGTVSRKRFWKGNFLFSRDDVAMGSPGFKRFRPVVVRKGRAVALGNDAIKKSPSYGDFGLQQDGANSSSFYDLMDDVLSPSPLDPQRAMLETIVALEEQVKARVISIENGEKHFRDGGSSIDMPSGNGIFETVGNWENYSTPGRDLRTLIATDVVRGFPSLVARRPERFKMPTGKTVDQVVEGLKATLRDELEKRRFEYIRSDGSKFSLSLADVLDRTPELEMAYNPNDCAESRWGAPAGSAEMATCKRRASSDQRKKMEKYRSWFHDRKRPSRS